MKREFDEAFDTESESHFQQTPKFSKRLAEQTEKDNTKSHLLELPPELREHVFEYALLSEDEIEIATDLQQPGLLATCYAIRGETLHMWYSNQFCIRIFDCDARLLTAFMRHCRNVTGKEILPDIELRGRKEWSNLMRWCKDVWNKEASWVMPEEGDEAYTAVITAACEIAWTCEESWETCEAMLKALRHAVGAFDDEWLH